MRQLACDLGISRTTAERIQDVLCEMTLAEVRPWSCAFVASQDGTTRDTRLPGVQAVCDFLKQTIRQARDLGFDTDRLAHLIGAFDEDVRPSRRSSLAWFPVIATRDAYECMVACFDATFPARVLHLMPTAVPGQFPEKARYLLSGYYLRGRARRIADAVKCSLLYVRYNVTLLDSSMSIPSDEFRYFVTPDDDDAETTRGFLASAYPEVPTTHYAVMSLQEFLKAETAGPLRGTVWPTITAAPLLKRIVPANRTTILHPLLADDFIQELRCLALLG